MLDFIRQNPGCSHDTEGANFHGARLARLHYLLDRRLVRGEHGGEGYVAPVRSGDRGLWRYYAVDTHPAAPAPAPVEEPVNPCELCGEPCGPRGYVSDLRCNDFGRGVVLDRVCARIVARFDDETFVAVLDAAAGVRRRNEALARAREVASSVDAHLEHAKAVVEASTRRELTVVERELARELTVEITRPFDGAEELDLAASVAESIRTRAIHCYACDGAVVGVRDLRYKGGRLELACARHAESHSEAAAAVTMGRALALAALPPSTPTAAPRRRDFETLDAVTLGIGRVESDS